MTVGRMADQSGGYRRYAVLASAVMAATAFVLAVVGAWALVIVCAFALGAGDGAFQSVSQALSNVVLPDPASAGRDLGIINIASAIPQVIGAPIAGLVVASGGGYRGLFVFAGLLAQRAPRSSPASRPHSAPPDRRHTPTRCRFGHQDSRLTEISGPMPLGPEAPPCAPTGSQPTCHAAASSRRAAYCSRTLAATEAS